MSQRQQKTPYLDGHSVFAVFQPHDLALSQHGAECVQGIVSPQFVVDILVLIGPQAAIAACVHGASAAGAVL
jgi:hypothetical protein